MCRGPLPSPTHCERSAHPAHMATGNVTVCGRSWGVLGRRLGMAAAWPAGQVMVRACRSIVKSVFAKCGHRRDDLRLRCHLGHRGAHGCAAVAGVAHQRLRHRRPSPFHVKATAREMAEHVKVKVNGQKPLSRNFDQQGRRISGGP